MSDPINPCDDLEAGDLRPCPFCAEALHAVADEIAGFMPVASTFKGMNGAQGAKVTLRMVVELLRERADGKPDTSRPATEEELNDTDRTGP